MNFSIQTLKLGLGLFGQEITGSQSLNGGIGFLGRHAPEPCIYPLCGEGTPGKRPTKVFLNHKA